MSPPIFYLTDSPYELICDNCKKGFMFPIGIDGIMKMDNPKFVCGIKCYSEIKKEIKENVA